METDARYVGLLYEVVHLIYNNEEKQYEVWSADEEITEEEPWKLLKNQRDKYAADLISGAGWQYSFTAANDDAAREKVANSLMGGYYSY